MTTNFSARYQWPRSLWRSDPALRFHQKYLVFGRRGWNDEFSFLGELSL